MGVVPEWDRGQLRAICDGQGSDLQQTPCLQPVVVKDRRAERQTRYRREQGPFIWASWHLKATGGEEIFDRDLGSDPLPNSPGLVGRDDIL
jgi:hypothetical protein